MKWLWSNEDFDALHEADLSELAFALWDNGIICKRDAAMQLMYASTNFDVPDCPHCGANDNRHYPLNEGRWKCKKCRRKFSLTTKRYIDNTKLPLTHWWRFCYLVGEMKITNSCFIASDLEVTQKTAWLMLDTVKTALKDSGIIVIKNLPVENDVEVRKLLMGVKPTVSKLRKRTTEEIEASRCAAYEYLIP